MALGSPASFDFSEWFDIPKADADGLTCSPIGAFAAHDEAPTGLHQHPASIPKLPLPPLAPMAPMAPSSEPGTSSLIPIQVPGVLSTTVDASQYGLINQHEWERASVDYASDLAASTSPFSDEAPTPSSLEHASYPQCSLANGPSKGDEMGIQYLQSASHEAESHPASIRVAPMPLAIPTPLYPPMVSFQAAGAAEKSALFGQRPLPPIYPESLPHQLDEEGHAAPYPASFDATSPGDESDAQSPEDTESTASERAVNETDAGLVTRLRQEGWSYKKIRAEHFPHKAESTLRGCARAHRLPAEQRPRKPVWTDADADLLTEAVHHFMEVEGYKNKAKSYRKAPWTKVAQRMKERGASHHFSAANCSKKFGELQREQEEEARKKRKVVSRRSARNTD